MNNFSHVKQDLEKFDVVLATDDKIYHSGDMNNNNIIFVLKIQKTSDVFVNVSLYFVNNKQSFMTLQNGFSRRLQEVLNALERTNENTTVRELYKWLK